MAREYGTAVAEPEAEGLNPEKEQLRQEIADKRQFVLDYCRRLIHGKRYRKIDPEDLTSETILRALQSVDTFKEGGNLEAWLMRIAQNLAVDRIRYWNTEKRKGEVDIEPGPYDGEEDEPSRLENFPDSRSGESAVNRRILIHEIKDIISQLQNPSAKFWNYTCCKASKSGRSPRNWRSLSERLQVKSLWPKKN